MNKERIKNSILFADAILISILIPIALAEYKTFLFYESKGILGVTSWALYLITIIIILITMLLSIFNKRKYIMPSVIISSIFIFISLNAFSGKVAEMYNSALPLTIIFVISILYTIIRAYLYSLCK